MVGRSRNAGNREARNRAQQQRVYISGLQGHHPLELGIAYYYRGHFIYAYPNGNPIEPLLFSTRRGISIVGITADRAPPYDANASNLVRENSIAALEKSRNNESISQMRQEEDQTSQDLGHGNEDVQASSTSANTQQMNVPTVHVTDADAHAQTLSMPSVPIHTSQTSATQPTYTPHNRAQYLAYSAPVSRHASTSNTPQTSRPVSPSQRPASRQGSSLRTVASASRLSHLLAEEEKRRRAFSPLEEVAEGTSSHHATAQDHTSNMYTEDSGEEEEEKKAIGSANELYLPGLGHIDASARPSELRSVSAFPATRELRARSASLALNQAYNASVAVAAAAVADPGCPIHGKTCDGKTTSEMRLSERARGGAGFKEECPMIWCGNGVEVVNWWGLCEEEKGRLG